MARKDPKLAQKIRDKIKKWDDNWRFNRTQYHEYMDFVMGDMWKEDESKVFTRYNKIPLVMNKLAPLTSYMLGDQRQNTPMLEVSPDENVPEELVEIRKALIKHISFDSDAKVAYQGAFQQAIIGGFGAYYLDTAYESEYSFNLDIKVCAIKDPTRCYWDVSAETPCKTDGMYAGRRTRISRKRFASMYGEKLEQSIPSSNYSDDTSLMSFNDDDSITVIDDYERKYDIVKIYKLSDNSVVDKKELDEFDRFEIEGREILMFEGQGIEIVEEREAYRYKVIHRKIAGDYILEQNDFPSEQLPVIFVDQNSYWDKDGKQICRPFFKDARDAQRYLNYLATQSAYLVKVSRYDQFLVSKANVKSADTQAIWRDPQTQQGGLVYDESPNGNKPEQLRPAELPVSLIQQYERTLHDIETSTGIYATQIGQQGNEMSGKAVDARTKRGSYNTFVPYDNLNRAILCGGQIIDEMIPKVYDVERNMMLKMSDQLQKPVTLNQPQDEYGTAIHNDMSKGRFRVRLLPGPSYEGQKQEALESLQLVLGADKSGQILPMIIDLYVENLPFQNNIELRNRLRTMVPPEIIEAGKTGKPMPPKQESPPPEIMIKMEEIGLKKQQLQNQMQETQMKAQAHIRELELKQRELEIKVDHDSQRVQMEWQKLEAEKLEAAAKLEEQEMRFRAEMARISTDADISHANNISKLLIHAGDIHRPEPKKHKEE